MPQVDWGGIAKEANPEMTGLATRGSEPPGPNPGRTRSWETWRLVT